MQQLHRAERISEVCAKSTVALPRPGWMARCLVTGVATPATFPGRRKSGASH
jgi:hypothetical protein